MIFEDFKKVLAGEFPQVSERQLEQFRAMDALYREWNERINVISRKDIDGLYEHHVLHSLAIASYLKRMRPDDCEAFAEASVLDLGTGGGFPGVPLAILFPAARFTLCDSIGKKVRVAQEVTSALGLENVETVNARAESLGRSFDYVVSRAVTTLDNFYPWVKDSFRKSILYLKGGDVNSEIASLMGRFKLAKGSVHSWKIASWLDEEYFSEKFVIQIEKDYLCRPIPKI